MADESNIAPGSPPDLHSSETLKDRKSLYRRRRNEFRGNAQAMKELEEWKRRNDSYDYHQLRPGLIPTAVIRKAFGGDVFTSCDTWFSEFKAHNDATLILSESADSYIIGNKASYDRRQYHTPVSLKYKGDPTPEGQGFGHCLVIPKERIFNVVDPDATANDCVLLRKMKAHFVTFWNMNGSLKLLAQVRSSFDKLNPVIDGIEDSTTATYISKLEDDFDSLAQEFLKLTPEDFEYGFHAYPDISVGHLHMHVFPRKSSLRQFSAKQHDWKTIPLEAVLEVEKEDELGKGEASVERKVSHKGGTPETGAEE